MHSDMTREGHLPCAAVLVCILSLYCCGVLFGTSKYILCARRLELGDSASLCTGMHIIALLLWLEWVNRDERVD